MSDKIIELLTEAAEISQRALIRSRRRRRRALRLESQADTLRIKAEDIRPDGRNGPAPDAEQAVRSLRRGDQAEGLRGLTISSLVEIGVPASPRVRGGVRWPSLRQGDRPSRPSLPFGVTSCELGRQPTPRGPTM